jgi:hypothetical protein
MPTEFTIRVPLPDGMSANEYWQLRSEFELEKRVALSEKRMLDLNRDDVTRVESATGDTTISREVVCKLPADIIPKVLQPFCKPEHLETLVTTEFCPDLCDCEHALKTSIIFPKLPVHNVTMFAKQWLQDEVIVSQCSVAVTSPTAPNWAVGMVEKIIEATTRSAYHSFPKKLGVAARELDKTCIDKSDQNTTSNVSHKKPRLIRPRRRKCVDRVATAELDYTSDTEFTGVETVSNAADRRTRIPRCLCKCSFGFLSLTCKTSRVTE